MSNRQLIDFDVYEQERIARLEAEKRLDEKTREVDTGLNILTKQYEQLVQAQKQVLRSEKLASIGQLAAGVAHEINNPVGFVLSNLEVMSDYLSLFEKLIDKVSSWSERQEALSIWSDENELDYVRNDAPILIQESIVGLKRVREIVSDLNKFARVSDHQLESVDVNELIEAAVKVVWNQLKYSCKVCFNLSSSRIISCHTGQLSQVLVNLLVNASHAIQARKDNRKKVDQGVIEIITMDVDSGIRLGIKDNGCGISNEYKEKVFDPFFTTKPIGEGTGLGLSTVIGIVDKHRGQLELETKEGEGTTIWIEMPCKGNE